MKAAGLETLGIPEIGRGHGTPQVINTASAQFQCLCLPRDRELVRLVDRRFAPSMPAEPAHIS